MTIICLQKLTSAIPHRTWRRLALLVVIAPVFAAPFSLRADIAAKSYVDRLDDNVQNNYVSIINMANMISDAIAGKADKSALAPVATSGNYNDLTNKPTIPAAQIQADWTQTNAAAADYIKNKPNTANTGIGTASSGTIGQIISTGASNAATGEFIQLVMDNWTFKATKQSTANYWGVRLVNTTGAVATVGATWLQLYGGTQARNSESVNLATGAEFNPDAETGDVGYGKEDTAIVHIFDTTNMHLYRWTITVYVNKAVMAVEKLY
ncbi:MAG: hypothetical protein FWC51_00125 [Proteobacteria bacterium]|nr:hypothetical protein [Pseudomonadota bacterium]